MPIELRQSASEHSLTIITPIGRQRFDLSKLNENQLAGARELVVNFWCKENGFPELFK